VCLIFRFIFCFVFIFGMILRWCLFLVWMVELFVFVFGRFLCLVGGGCCYLVL